MDLLKQTSLILGLVSLTLGVWTLFRDWRNRVSVLFSFLCFLVSIWALSFVSHATLLGRLSRDIHLFCNVLLAPTGVLLMSSFLVRKVGLFSRVLFSLSLAGGAVLCFMIAFSLGSGTAFRKLAEFWPSFILFEYLHLLMLEVRSRRAADSDRFSPGRKWILYLGPGLSLAFCTFDHVPAMGYVLPSVGNLLFTLYLGFASQVVNPRKMFKIDFLLSRFFAILTLSLVLTGFFALLYGYVSRSFPLFLLNSFLISFAVLALWSPLVTFFKFIGQSVFPFQSDEDREMLERFRVLLSGVTSLRGLEEGLKSLFLRMLRAEDVEVALDPAGIRVPEPVERYLLELTDRGLAPVLHRRILESEREVILTRDARKNLDLVLEFLNAGGFDIVLPAFKSGRVTALIRIRGAEGRDFSRPPAMMSELAEAAERVARIGEAQERERLMLLGEMAAGLAHEIRNPLGAIRGAADLLSEPGPFVGIIRDETARLNRLVGQFLDFSRVPQVATQRIELNGLLPKAIETMRFLVPRQVELRVELSPEPVWIQVVPDSIQQVLHNLIQNAVKALEGVDRGWIRIRTEPRGFSVIDNGIGMSEEVRSRVLEPFFTSFTKGSGLGLSICERLVRHDLGTLRIDSAPGSGTRVEVEYPDAR
jgi:two-component system sensor histidine kinase HydH